jgi:membrane-associated protein
VLVGVLAGAWLQDQPVLGALVAILVALVGGLLIDLAMRRLRSPRSRESGLSVASAVRW